MLARIIYGCVVSLACVLLPQAAMAQARVELELATAKGFPPLDTQRWYQALTNLKFDGLRIRQGNGSEEVKIDNLGTETSPRYRVRGVLSARGEMPVPQGRFSINDRAAMSAWLERLRKEGPGGEKPTGQRKPYGLSDAAFQLVLADLSQTVLEATAGQPLNAVMGRIRDQLGLALDVDAVARAAFARNTDTVSEEYKGLSCGTALAALVRPLGLALEVQSAGGRPTYILRSGQTSREPWPIGFEPKESRTRLLPVLYTRIEVEIVDRPAAEVLATLQPRLEVPVLYDRNSLLKHGIDLDEKIRIPQGQYTYLRLLGGVLSPLKAKFELRVDEQDRPFLWITSLKR